MKYCTVLLVAILTSFLIAVFCVGNCSAIENEPKTVIPAIMQAPNPPGGLMTVSVIDRTDPNCPNYPFIYRWSYDQTCRTFPYPTDWSGENLLVNSGFSNGLDGWNVLYAPDPATCHFTISNGAITMTQDIAGIGCGINQLFGDRKARDKKYRIAYNTTQSDGESEVYTEPDGVKRYPGVGTVTQVITQPMVWLQNKSTGFFPNSVTIRDLVIREIK